MDRPTDTRAGDAFRRLLAEASVDERARVDALIAFSQRTVWVATWEPVSPTWRTIEHEDGALALPVFSDEVELERAAAALEWTRGPIRAGRKEVGAREAMRLVIEQQYGFLVIDLAAEHCIEATRAEIEPLARAGSRSDSQGPYAAVGRITSTMMEAVRTSQGSSDRNTPVPASDPRSSAPPRGGSLPAATPAPPAAGFSGATSFAPRTSSLIPSQPLRGPSVVPATPLRGPSVVPSQGSPGTTRTLTPALGVTGAVPHEALGDSNAVVAPVDHEPSDAFLDALSEALKRFPEVEWATYCMAALGGGSPVPMIGIRVDASFRNRVANISAAIAGVADAHRLDVPTLLLDKPNLMREARQEGIPFHPWRRRKTGSFGPVQ